MDTFTATPQFHGYHFQSASFVVVVVMVVHRVQCFGGGRWTVVRTPVDGFPFHAQESPECPSNNFRRRNGRCQYTGPGVPGKVFLQYSRRG